MLLYKATVYLAVNMVVKYIFRMLQEIRGKGVAFYLFYFLCALPCRHFVLFKVDIKEWR